MTERPTIRPIHWKMYLRFLKMIECNKINMYGALYKNVKGIHDIIHGQHYSISDFNQIFYN